MNIVVKSAEVECRRLLMKSGVRQPPIRAYMDDLTMKKSSVPGSRWILQGLERLISWARMSFKPAKSRSLVLKGKVVSEKPVKSLGKLFDCSFKDTATEPVVI